MLMNKQFFCLQTLIFLFFVTRCLLPAHAQWFPSTLLTTPTLMEADSNKLLLKTDITAFFKNNEYFSPVAVGQTLPGVVANFVLGYQISDRFKAELGAYAVKYSGRIALVNLQTFMRLQYAITPNFNMTLGNLYGGVNHRLIEPLYQWERHFTDNPESGLQFVFHNKGWFVDTWIDWENFIQRGDPVLERLTFGASVKKTLTDDNSRFSLNVPLQLLIHHHGGQIDTSDDPMIVLGNLATGLCSDWKTGYGWFKSLGLDVFVAGYWDKLKDEELRPFDKGWGIYPVLHSDFLSFKCMIGYWYAHKFYNFQGEPLFGSFDPFNPEKQLPTRHLLNFKFTYEKQVLKAVSLGAYWESYTDLNLSQTDYSFGVHLRFNHQFLIKN